MTFELLELKRTKFFESTRLGELWFINYWNNSFSQKHLLGTDNKNNIKPRSKKNKNKTQILKTERKYEELFRHSLIESETPSLD
ncbi:hypothetical protein BpHYR1_034694 [Brachionus plicatilis]|uniref:Uncharacterized protein n=1 Tax=Brachionus plicatilis TaxID=10195 RepID=A0A3M7SGV0_BRAPC|nr:hypothetical protein BpHYR1_034694 [Brachionus plicatilis]